MKHQVKFLNQNRFLGIYYCSIGARAMDE